MEFALLQQLNHVARPLVLATLLFVSFRSNEAQTCSSSNGVLTSFFVEGRWSCNKTTADCDEQYCQMVLNTTRFAFVLNSTDKCREHFTCKPTTYLDTRKCKSDENAGLVLCANCNTTSNCSLNLNREILVTTPPPKAHNFSGSNDSTLDALNGNISCEINKRMQSKRNTECAIRVCKVNDCTVCTCLFVCHRKKNISSSRHTGHTGHTTVLYISVVVSVFVVVLVLLLVFVRRRRRFKRRHSSRFEVNVQAADIVSNPSPAPPDESSCFPTSPLEDELVSDVVEREEDPYERPRFESDISYAYPTFNNRETNVESGEYHYAYDHMWRRNTLPKQEPVYVNTIERRDSKKRLSIEEDGAGTDCPDGGYQNMFPPNSLESLVDDGYQNMCAINCPESVDEDGYERTSTVIFPEQAEQNVSVVEYVDVM